MFNTTFLFLILIAFLAFSCSKPEGCTDESASNFDADAEKDDGTCVYDNNYDIPGSYSFENVSYSGQTDRLNMMEEMTVYLKTANESGVSLDLNKLMEMYENTGSHYSFQSDRQLKDKTFSLVQDSFENFFTYIVDASQSKVPGSNGTPGVVTSNDGQSAYLCDANGIEWTQLIEKGLMGACFYYQATSVYLSEDRIGNSVDNEIVEPGEGTEMEHHWDEAFGYLGVPKDFPQNKDGVRFHGKYANGRDAYLNCNETLMNAFIKGRAAISNKDMTTKEQQIDIIRSEWENVIAATAVHYLNSGKANITDDAKRNHALSEAIAFIWSLKFNEDKSITNQQVDDWLETLGNNLYEVEVSTLNTLRDDISSKFGFDEYKEQL